MRSKGVPRGGGSGIGIGDGGNGEGRGGAGRRRLPRPPASIFGDRRVRVCGADQLLILAPYLRDPIAFIP